MTLDTESFVYFKVAGWQGSHKTHKELFLGLGSYELGHNENTWVTQYICPLREIIILVVRFFPNKTVDIVQVN